MDKTSKHPVKKLSKETSEEFMAEPLDHLSISVNTRDGTQKLVPSISIGFMQPRSYVSYKPISCLLHPYVGFCDDAEIDEWLERMSLFEESLTWLLKLPHQRFWCQVMFDEKLHTSLQSYLSRAPRDYDLNSSCREDILTRQRCVHRLIFLVFLRMATYKESKSHHLTPSVFAEMIYENFIFDIPRMMDLSVLYGFDNEQIMRKMIQNLFANQPSYLDDLEDCISITITVFENIKQKLNLKSHSGNEKVPHKLEEHDTSLLRSLQLAELLDVVNFITDTSATLYCFFEACPPAGVTFYKHKGPLQIPPFYDLVFPVLEKEVTYRAKNGDSQLYIDALSRKLVFSKSFLVKAFRNIVTSSCIHPVLNARCDMVDESNGDFFHLENYLQLFTEIATEKMFLNDYNKLFPLSEDVELFSAAGVQIDVASLNYILSGLSSSASHTAQLPAHDTALCSSKGDSNHVPPTKEINNIQELAAALCPTKDESRNGDSDFYSANCSSAKPDDVQLMSLIQSILDVIPNYGDGFLEACLEHYNFDCEKVIDAVLTNVLPPHLASMDTKTQRNVPNTATDDGLDSYLSGRKSIFDGDEFDVFNRDDVAMSRIHRGKSGKTPDNYKDLSTDEQCSMLKALTLKYEEEMEMDEEKAREQLILYEDEYDDTYDSYAVGLIEVQPENELLRLRPTRVPAALKASVKAGRSDDAQDQADEDEEDEEKNDSVTSNETGATEFMDKEGDFYMNPALLRQKAEERHQAQIAKKRASHPQVQDFRNKERNKGHGANHNRRKQSDFKRSRGILSTR